MQYYYQTTTGDGQMVMVGGKQIIIILTNILFNLKIFSGLSEHDAQLMSDTQENNIDNVTQIVLPSQPDKIKKDLPQVNKIFIIYINV